MRVHARRRAGERLWLATQAVKPRGRQMFTRHAAIILRGTAHHGLANSTVGWRYRMDLCRICGRQQPHKGHGRGPHRGAARHLFRGNGDSGIRSVSNKRKRQVLAKLAVVKEHVPLLRWARRGVVPVRAVVVMLLLSQAFAKELCGQRRGHAIRANRAARRNRAKPIAH